MSGKGWRERDRCEPSSNESASASVTVGEETVGGCGPGLLILLGVAAEDDARRRRRARGQGRAAPDLRERRGQVRPLDRRHRRGGARRQSVHALADTTRGKSPEFLGRRAPRACRAALFERFCARSRRTGVPVATGMFGARMSVELVNDGPVTIVLGLRCRGSRSHVEPVLSFSHRISWLDEMGARAPIFVEETSSRATRRTGWPTCSQRNGSSPGTSSRRSSAPSRASRCSRSSCFRRAGSASTSITQTVSITRCARASPRSSPTTEARTRSTSRRPGLDRPLRTTRALSGRDRPGRPDSHGRRDLRQEEVSRPRCGRVGTEPPHRRRRRGARHPVRRNRPGQPDR